MMNLKPTFVGATGLGLRVVHFAAIGKMVIDSGAAFLGAHGQGFGHFGRRLVKGFHKEEYGAVFWGGQGMKGTVGCRLA